MTEEGKRRTKGNRRPETLGANNMECVGLSLAGCAPGRIGGGRAYLRRSENPQQEAVACKHYKYTKFSILFSMWCGWGPQISCFEVNYLSSFIFSLMQHRLESEVTVSRARGRHGEREARIEEILISLEFCINKLWLVL